METLSDCSWINRYANRPPWTRQLCGPSGPAQIAQVEVSLRSRFGRINLPERPALHIYRIASIQLDFTRIDMQKSHPIDGHVSCPRRVAGRQLFQSALVWMRAPLRRDCL